MWVGGERDVLFHHVRAESRRLGLDNVRFRGKVQPGDRLVLVAKGLRVHRRQCQFSVQGFVGTTMVFNGDILGVAMTRAAVVDAPEVVGAAGEA